MFDLGSLSNLAQIASVLVAGGYSLWRLLILPGMKFREKMREELASMQNKIITLEAKINSLECTVTDELQELSEEFKNDLADVHKDHDELRKDMNAHVTKIDSKNEKLLDLIIKYFNKID